VVRANQYFTQDLYLQLFFQTNSAIDRRNVQAVFVYRCKPPFGTLQMAFQRGTAECCRAEAIEKFTPLRSQMLFQGSAICSSS
jgi:hypothetical protein